MKALEIHLKGGGSFTVEATECSWVRHTADDEFRSLTWTTPNGAERKLLGVSPTQIAALVAIQ